MASTMVFHLPATVTREQCISCLIDSGWLIHSSVGLHVVVVIPRLLDGRLQSKLSFRRHPCFIAGSALHFIVHTKRAHRSGVLNGIVQEVIQYVIQVLRPNNKLSYTPNGGCESGLSTAGFEYPAKGPLQQVRAAKARGGCPSSTLFTLTRLGIDSSAPRLVLMRFLTRSEVVTGHHILLQEVSLSF